MGETEVTQGQFTSAMGYNPANHSKCGASCPVEMVTWHEAAAYCNSLSMAKDQCYTCTGAGATTECKIKSLYSGKSFYSCPGFRLPTDAEWEYAYRAGTTTAYYNGTNNSSLCLVCTPKDVNLDKISWYCGNSSTTSQPVGKKVANAWGLYDMPGNVYEFVNDFWQADLGSSAAIDPTGPASGTQCVVRGGHMNGQPTLHRAAHRVLGKKEANQNGRYYQVGFRCARSAK